MLRFANHDWAFEKLGLHKLLVSCGSNPKLKITLSMLIITWLSSLPREDRPRSANSSCKLDMSCSLNTQ